MTSARPLIFVLLAGAGFDAAAWAQTAPPARELAPAQRVPADFAPAPVAPAAPATPIVTPESAVQTEAEAEEPPAESAAGDGAFEVKAVVVKGIRLRGSVRGDIPPDIQLDAEDIAALGAGTLSELLEVLAPQIRSGRGRENGPPVTLLNGRRISGFQEIARIPPEAIERIDILPEEVALKYGFRADQRVVNFVLRENFRATTAEVQAGAATAGGRNDGGAELGRLRISKDRRTSVDVEYRGASSLLESERDLIQTARGGPFSLPGNVGAVRRGGEIDPALSALAGRPVTVAGVPASAAGSAPSLADFAVTAGAPSVTDLGDVRTLLPETERFALNGTINRTIFDDVSATVNARYEHSASQSLFGLPSAALTLRADSPFSPFGDDVLLYRLFDTPGPLTRQSETDTARLGLVLDGFVDDWRWSLTAGYDLVDTVSETEVGVDATAIQARLDAGDSSLNPFAVLPGDLLAERPRDRAESRTQTVNTQLVVNGALKQLPAGALSTTLKAELEARGFESETLRSGVREAAELSRERGAFQANFDIPIASRSRKVLSGLGDLTANANLALDQLSDFGTLRTLGYGLNWSPKEKLRLLASVTDEEGAPSVQQLGDPVLITPNVPVFDFTRGETVEVTRVEGGNPGLVADNRRVLKLEAGLRPYTERDLSLNLTYTATRTDDPITFFPGATPEIEAAFPDRFVRDADGRLLRVDGRPVNFARSDRRELRTGFNYSRPLRREDARGAGSGPGRAGAGSPGATGAPPAEGADAANAGGVRGTRRPRGVDGAAEQRLDRPAGEGRFDAGQRGPGGGGPRPGGPGGFGGRGGGFGGRGGGFAGGREGRLQFSLYHTWRLEDSILVREGGPELDLLNGSALGSGGGRPEHEIDVQAGLFKSGFGAFLNGRYQSGTFVTGRSAGPDGPSGDLFFSDLTTVNLRVFADLGQRRRLVARYPFFRGARASVAVNNLFDQRLDVRDAAGATPLSLQPAFLDPLGRSVRISFRKLFAPAAVLDAPRRSRRSQ